MDCIIFSLAIEGPRINRGMGNLKRGGARQQASPCSCRDGKKSQRLMGQYAVTVAATEVSSQRNLPVKTELETQPENSQEQAGRRLR